MTELKMLASIWTSNIEDIWTLKIQSVKIESQTEIAGDIREIL